MDNKTIGIVAALAGVISFLYSFGKVAENAQIYFWVGLVLIIGGLFWAKYVKD